MAPNYPGACTCTGADLWQADNLGMTALHHAANSGHAMTVRRLLLNPSPPRSRVVESFLPLTTRRAVRSERCGQRDWECTLHSKNVGASEQAGERVATDVMHTWLSPNSGKCGGHKQLNGGDGGGHRDRGVGVCLADLQVRERRT
eukprot:364198-Chlamydomonas_euryale.AAC.9